MSISSLDENVIAREQAGKICGSNPYWAGGSAINNTTQVVTFTDGTTHTWGNFGSSEPNGDANARLEIASNGSWNDLSSTATRSCYVCERLLATACDDKKACTTGDVCQGSTCGGLPVECSSKCKVSQTCAESTGCPTLSAASHLQLSPAFCDSSASLTCNAGTCGTKASACGSSTCGYDSGSSDCGKCNAGSACKTTKTCATYASLAGTALLPGGAFVMGCVLSDTLCDTDELPRHSAYVSPFYMDNTEVSVASYQACMTAGKCTFPALIGTMPSNANLPLTKMTWDQARAYCAWKGTTFATAGVTGDLPTQTQWEYAARYHKSGVLNPGIYPWGNAWPPPGGSAPANWGVSTLTDGAAGVDVVGHVFDDITGMGL
ncbi:MAG: SUMF1/EgtB/PvdO family nonheme iron enzyme, partial [Deltaproteobacteria bacterium]|nr:SUMF1/EgtB/PvdO family nonheme iron enzyme [Deltaproteobacteria bacterium]